MILIEKTQIMGLEPTIRGMRNPMNSWAKSDSNIGCEHNLCENCDINRELCEEMPRYIVGPNDLDLMLRLGRRQVPPDDRGVRRHHRPALLVEGVRHL